MGGAREAERVAAEDAIALRKAGCARHGGKILEPGAFEHDAGLADTGVAAERRRQSGRRVKQARRVGERAGDFLGMRAARESERKQGACQEGREL